MLVAPVVSGRHAEVLAKPFCRCWGKRTSVPWEQLTPCTCGEEDNVIEWKWEEPRVGGSSWVVVQDAHTQLTFHPFYSSGTAAARGDTPLLPNYHHYWEVKILTETYGTDIMVGVGTSKVDLALSQFKFTSLLGQDAESYGLSYKGVMRHNAQVSGEAAGFCRGSIVGVRLDMWQGTLQFYVNRKPQGTAFYNLRRHPELFPLVCSTAAQSGMRLIYASSWRASLLVDAAKILAQSVSDHSQLPPGLQNTFKKLFWLTLPTEDTEEEDTPEVLAERSQRATMPLSSGMKRRHWQMMTRAACARHDHAS